MKYVGDFWYVKNFSRIKLFSAIFFAKIIFFQLCTILSKIDIFRFLRLLWMQILSRTRIILNFWSRSKIKEKILPVVGHYQKKVVRFIRLQYRHFIYKIVYIYIIKATDQNFHSINRVPIKNCRNSAFSGP